MSDKVKPELFLYPANLKEATRLQKIMADKIIIKPLRKEPRLVVAADATFTPDLVLAAVCLFSYPELELVETATAEVPLRFPYRTGFLSFCEGPAVFQAINSLSRKPDLLLLDGQGIAHPRRLGLASFVGLLFGLPAIGCAKSHLVGDFLPPAPEAGSCSELFYHGQLVGYVLRSRARVRPIFISPGHLIDPDSSLRIILGCLKGYRIPEPLRLAHQLTTELRARKKLF
ncbi:MAG: endonuclease V [Candidatus Saccharicenans sp.]